MMLKKPYDPPGLEIQMQIGLFPFSEFVKYQLVVTNLIFCSPKASELHPGSKQRQVIIFYQCSTDGAKMCRLSYKI